MTSLPGRITGAARGPWSEHDHPCVRRSWLDSEVVTGMVCGSLCSATLSRGYPAASTGDGPVKLARVGKRGPETEGSGGCVDHAFVAQKEVWSAEATKFGLTSDGRFTDRFGVSVAV